jgi:hypothetical protein
MESLLATQFKETEAKNAVISGTAERKGTRFNIEDFKA